MTFRKLPLVVTIIVHYNAINECLQIIEDLLLSDYTNHQLVVVDNPSTDEVFVELKSKLTFPNVHLVRNIANNGYGSGINFGINHAKPLKASYYHIINTDTRLVSKQYISNLVNNFENDSSIGMIGPGVIASSGAIQNTIMPFISINNAVHFKSNNKDKSKIETPPRLHPAEVINGVCFMVRAEAFYKVGGFDEDFFMYGEEHDFCYRMNKIGFNSFFWSGAAVLHNNEHSPTFNQFNWRDLLTRCNQILFLKKHKSKLAAIILSTLFSLSLTKKKIRGQRFEQTFIKTLIALFKPEQYNKERHLYNN